jgi:cytochrome c oxidase subunit IV
VEDTAGSLVAPAEHADDVQAGAEHAHPGPAAYVWVAVVLAIVTAIEVGLYYLGLSDRLLVAMLLGLAFIKFSLVAAYFMHLKFDAVLLRRVFVTGIILAIGVYAIALITLDVLFH